jgi:hypothetical protein
MATKKPEKKEIIIPPLNLERGIFKIEGDTIMVQNKFSEKAKREMIETQKAGSTAKKGGKKKPKDFKEMFKQSQHISEKGWNGIPASAIRAGCISACRLVGFKMTLAKLSIFVIEDGYDKNDKTPLIKITRGKALYRDDAVRIQNTCDVHARAMFLPGWQAKVCLEWDADQFKLEDVSNLLVRMGKQVGLGEGRPDSRSSAGMGWGTFKVLGKE